MKIKTILFSLLVASAASCADSSSGQQGLTPDVQISGGTSSTSNNGSTQQGATESKLEVIFAENGEQSTARNFYFVIDGSGSMSGEAMRQAKSGTKAFTGNIPEKDQIGMYAFDSSGRSERVKLGAGNRKEFLIALNDINTGGGTPLGDAIFTGCDALIAQYKQQLGYGEYRLVVVTDGAPSDEHNFDRAIEYANKAQIPIFTIGYRINGNHALRQHSVSYRDASNEHDLQRGLEEVLAETETFDAASFEELYQFSK